MNPTEAEQRVEAQIRRPSFRLILGLEKTEPRDEDSISEKHSRDVYLIETAAAEKALQHSYPRAVRMPERVAKVRLLAIGNSLNVFRTPRTRRQPRTSRLSHDRVHPFLL